MNTSKKKSICCIIVLFMIFISAFAIRKPLEVYAAPINCSSYGSKNSCENGAGRYKCRWISGSCQQQNVAVDPCNDNNIRKVLKVLGYLLMIAKWALPFIIIGFGVKDFYKAIIDKDDKILSKQIKRFVVRVVTGIFVFFIPNILYAIFSLSDRLNIVDTSQYKICAACVLDPMDDSMCLVN